MNSVPLRRTIGHLSLRLLALTRKHTSLSVIARMRSFEIATRRGVARQIVEHLLGPAQGLLGIDHPVMGVEERAQLAPGVFVQAMGLTDLNATSFLFGSSTPTT